MGRPPIGKIAMTDAERQRRRRALLRDAKPVTKPADGKAVLAAIEGMYDCERPELAGRLMEPLNPAPNVEWGTRLWLIASMIDRLPDREQQIEALADAIQELRVKTVAPPKKRKPKWKPADWPELKAAIARYVEGRARVNYERLCSVIFKEVPELEALSARRKFIALSMKELGFYVTSPSTFVSRAPHRRGEK